MKEFVLSRSISPQKTAKLAGEYAKDSDYDLLIDEECDVRKEDGSPLAMLLRGRLDPEHSRNAFKAFQVYQGSRNRGTGSGNIYKARRIKKDGTKARTVETKETMKTGIIGYFDRTARFPFARKSAFLSQHKAEWKLAQPFIKNVSRLYSEYMPSKYVVQAAVAQSVPQEWVIDGTPFSTITVNQNWQIAYHQDAGDLSLGFGVMAYLQAGELEGGYLCIPAYRVAFKLRSCDLLLFDVHEFHGVTPIKQIPGTSQRMTVVFYFRENLVRCGSASHEAERAKNCRQLKKLYSPEEIEKGDSILRKASRMAKSD